MDKFSDNFIRYLKNLGHKSSEIDIFTRDTRLYHDLGLYGDEAEDYLEDLHKNYNVDFSTFNFLEYFPPEWPIADNQWQFILYLFWHPKINPDDYKPFTLGMLEQAMIEKVWDAG